MERGKGRGRERGREGCFCKRFLFLLLAAGSPPDKFAVILNLCNKPTKVTKVNQTFSWSSALEICGEGCLFFQKGLKNNLILLGTALTLNQAIALNQAVASLGSGISSALETFAAIVTSLLKCIGPSHGPVPWKFAEKLFFNKALVSDLILLGKAHRHFFSRHVKYFFAQRQFLTNAVCQKFQPKS